MLYDNVLHNYTIAIGDNMTNQSLEDLQDSLESFGTLLRNNLRVKGVNTSNTDNLMTLVDKVNDIEVEEPPSGFFVDIGMYDSDNWTSAPTITNDKIILNEGYYSFLCDNVTFPSTFIVVFPP